MKNQTIAEIFDRIADLLEIKGEDPFRIRAYRRAAAVIDGLPENLSEICKRGQLEEIPGVGKAIAAKIRDILETGTTPLYEQLKSELPEALLDILALPGIGPKTVRLLYNNLGIKTIDELEEAARNHQLRSTIKLGAKAEGNILRAIEAMRRRDDRKSLGTILPMAEEIASRLERTYGFEKVVIAGSLRRRCDTIGDIDLIALPSDREHAIKSFTSLSQIDEIIETGESMCAVRLKDGTRIDLRLADEDGFGAMLHHFTGSVQHNIKMRGMAKEKGLSISEHGVFKIETGEKVLSGRTEEEIFAVNGLPWIPPELREDRGEIEAALNGTLPNLVDVSDIKSDLHVHSTASDGGNTIPEIVKAAKSAGYQYVAICDHSKSLTIAHGLSDERLLQQMDEIREINKNENDFYVLSGIEADIRSDGQLDANPDIIRKLDIVVGSVHHQYKNPPEVMTARIIKAIESGMVDILAHPTGRIINHRAPYEYDVEKVFDAAKAHSVALEINASPDRLDLNDIYIRMAKNRGLKLAVNTDAHNIFEFATIRYGVYMARRGWLEASNLLNTMKIEELYAWLNARRPREFGFQLTQQN